jgi:hypothetical protein
VTIFWSSAWQVHLERVTWEHFSSLSFCIYYSRAPQDSQLPNPAQFPDLPSLPRPQTGSLCFLLRQPKWFFLGCILTPSSPIVQVPHFLATFLSCVTPGFTFQLPGKASRLRGALTTPDLIWGLLFSRLHFWNPRLGRSGQVATSFFAPHSCSWSYSARMIYLGFHLALLWVLVESGSFLFPQR